MAINTPIRQHLMCSDDTALPDIRKAPVRELPSARMFKKLTGETMPTGVPSLPRIDTQALRARLHEARTRTGLTLADVQRRVGISAARLKYIESTGVRTTTRTVQRLAKLYGVSVEWLCYGVEE